MGFCFKKQEKQSIWRVKDWVYIYMYLYVVGLGLGLVGIEKHLVLLLKMDNFLGSLRMKFSRNGNGNGAF